jgi:hypothetical protein
MTKARAAAEFIGCRERLFGDFGLLCPFDEGTHHVFRGEMRRDCERGAAGVPRGIRDSGNDVSISARL